MFSATSEQFSRNPFAGLMDNSSGNNPQQGTENREPLPNPWNPRNPDGTPNTTQRPVANSPSMASLMQQMSENSDLMQNMMSAPYTQNVLEALAADPNMANAVMSNNPMLAGNPQLQEQVRQMMPTFLQQLQNPDIQNVMANPQVIVFFFFQVKCQNVEMFRFLQALNAIMQIQQGMETLRQAAPNLVNTFGIPGGLPTTSAATTNSETTSTTTSATAAPANTTTNTTTAPPSADHFSEVLLTTLLPFRSTITNVT